MKLRNVGKSAFRIIAAVGALTLVPGCPELLPFNENIIPSPSPFAIVGSEGNKLFYAERQAWSEGDDFRLDAPPSVPSDIYVLNLQTLETELFAEDIEAYAWEVVANVRWIAWLDRASGAITVRDLENASEATYFGQDTDQATFYPLEIVDGDRLVVSRTAGTAPAPALGEHEYVILDLESGAAVVVPNAAWNGSYAVEGDYIAFLNDEPTDVAPLSLEWTWNIDVLNLRTRELTSVATDIRSSSTAGLSIVDGQIIWREYKRGGFQAKAMSYDIASGDTSKLADDLGLRSGDVTVNLIAADANGLLLETYAGSLWTGETTTLSLRSYEGETAVLAEFTADISRPQTYEWVARFVGDFIVWTDPSTGVIWIYDIQTGGTQQFDPAVMG